jgi:glutamate racemase
MTRASEGGLARPIGFIDSGVGGLTVLHECLVSLPGEDFLYLGDSDYFPYGTKTVDELRERVGIVTSFLLERGVKMLVVACNSATATAGEEIARIAAGAGVPVVTVIGPESEIAATITETGRVGVLATPATVSSGAYRAALDRLGRPLTVTEVAAPDLAPLIQEGSPFDEDVMDMVRSYCEPLKRAEIDTLDATILAAVKRRTEVSQEIGKVRMASGGTRLVHSREMKVIERYSVLGQDGKDLAMLLLRMGRGRLGH